MDITFDNADFFHHDQIYLGLKLVKSYSSNVKRSIIYTRLNIVWKLQLLLLMI